MDKIQTRLCCLASDAVAREKTDPSKSRTVVLLKVKYVKLLQAAVSGWYIQVNQIFALAIS